MNVCLKTSHEECECACESVRVRARVCLFVCKNGSIELK